MADATGSNYYKRSFTEYEVEACKRDAAKRAQGCNECSLTEYEVEACKRDVADAHIFTAATAMAAKIERRAELDAEIPALEAEIAAATEAKAKRSAELDAEITALEAEIAAAKSKRNLSFMKI
jgi:septal ring factor EnvC (AmiA/AmiB activator)